MNERLRTLRSTLQLNQEDFGSKLNLSRSHVASLEKGARNLTERTLSDLSREFNVNENWLRTGQGEMFEAVSSDELDKLAEKYNLNPLAKKIVETFITLEENEMNSVLSFIDKISSSINDEVAAAKDDEDDIEKELESYRLELEAEKKGRISEVSESGEEKNVY